MGSQGVLACGGLILGATLLAPSLLFPHALSETVGESANG